MLEFPKIETLLDRGDNFKVIPDKWRLPEFQYLQSNNWMWQEKIDGTNIRIHWDHSAQVVTIGGRTDAAQTPTFLLNKLQLLFPKEKFTEVYPDICMTLYGEGFGAKIQKGGGNYIKDGCDFILFDVSIGGWWLEWDNVKDIGNKLGIRLVPVLSMGTLPMAVGLTQKGITSSFGNFLAEGLVVRPVVSLSTRLGQRIIGKIKTKDF